MKKIVLIALVFTSFFGLKAQYGSLDAILTKLEEKRGINQNLKNLNLDDIKFIMVKDFEDHTERNFVVIKGKSATYVEVFDDKKTGESTSNVFSGDVLRSNKNIVSLRCDKLEGKKIALPITKTFLLTQQNKITYLIDTNTTERWIDEKSFGKDSKQLKKH